MPVMSVRNPQERRAEGSPASRAVACLATSGCVCGFAFWIASVNALHRASASAELFGAECSAAVDVAYCSSKVHAPRGLAWRDFAFVEQCQQALEQAHVVNSAGPGNESRLGEAGMIEQHGRVRGQHPFKASLPSAGGIFGEVHDSEEFVENRGMQLDCVAHVHVHRCRPRCRVRGRVRRIVTFCKPSDRKISTAVLTMPSRVRAGLAGRLRRLDGPVG